MVSDKWLSKYGFLENIYAKFISFGFGIDFDLKPHSLPWTLVSDVMEKKLMLQGIYGVSMNAF